MKWSDNLPDVGGWQPRSDRTATLSSGLMVTCQATQSRIIREAEIERKFNIDNYDSGPGLEDFVRQELSKLLPDRYLVDAGVVNDQDGQTAGDYEVVIRDQRWAPVTKLGVTPGSRRYHFPVESIYSAVEVKQTLGFEQLDDAMKKLVTLSRLNRPYVSFGRITENRHRSQFDLDDHVANPLRTTVLGTRIQEGTMFRDLAMRFGRVNAHLTRDEMVTELCVLGHGLASFVVNDATSEYPEATYMYDRQKKIAMAIYEEQPDNAFYLLFSRLLGHLTRSVLQVDDIHIRYGISKPNAEIIGCDDAKFNASLSRQG